MKNKTFVFIRIVSISIMLVACGKDENTTTKVDNDIEPQFEEAAIEDTEAETDAQDDSPNYEENYLEVGGDIAMVTAPGNVKDSGYLEAIYNGMSQYAYAADMSYSYYSADTGTDDDYKDVLDTAIHNKASLIICAGEYFDSLIGQYQYDYPDISFLMVDGIPRDSDGQPTEIADNVYCISFDEDAAGYLAGYFTVMDGYTKLGFIGGEITDPVTGYGYGFIQGANDAAKTLSNTNDISINYWYSGTFTASDEIENVAASWYEEGTQVIFSCGGNILKSIVSAAEANNGLIIGVDVDQSQVSDTIITSAAKGVDTAIISSLDDYFAYDCWPETDGKVICFGTNEWCTNLPISDDSWRFKKVTVDQYYELYGDLRNGDIALNKDHSNKPDCEINVNYIKEN